MPAAYASDGTIEKRKTRLNGVPRMMFDHDATHLKVFQDFVDYVAEHKN